MEYEEFRRAGHYLVDSILWLRNGIEEPDPYCSYDR
jgi:hypothetical protein